MQFVVSAMLVVVGAVHLLPLLGVLGGAALERLYGISMSDPNLIILMRHRAMLFGVLGIFLIYAAFRVDLVWLAITAGLVSVGSFLWLAYATGAYNAAIARVVIADWIALACLLIAAACRVMAGRGG